MLLCLVYSRHICYTLFREVTHSLRLSVFPRNLYSKRKAGDVYVDVLFR
nr:MAG TPA: hypothetical protein [Caudoviricetes sp.]DAZ42576.1 MAG TPA: hypothetical protein [Caudoviricetes sp.]